MSGNDPNEQKSSGRRKRDLNPDATEFVPGKTYPGSPAQATASSKNLPSIVAAPAQAQVQYAPSTQPTTSSQLSTTISPAPEQGQNQPPPSNRPGFSSPNRRRNRFHIAPPHLQLRSARNYSPLYQFTTVLSPVTGSSGSHSSCHYTPLSAPFGDPFNGLRQQPQVVDEPVSPRTMTDRPGPVDHSSDQQHQAQPIGGTTFFGGPAQVQGYGQHQQEQQVNNSTYHSFLDGEAVRYYGQTQQAQPTYSYENDLIDSEAVGNSQQQQTQVLNSHGYTYFGSLGLANASTNWYDQTPQQFFDGNHNLRGYAYIGNVDVATRDRHAGRFAAELNLCHRITNAQAEFGQNANLTRLANTFIIEMRHFLTPMDWPHALRYAYWDGFLERVREVERLAEPQLVELHNTVTSYLYGQVPQMVPGPSRRR